MHAHTALRTIQRIGTGIEAGRVRENFGVEFSWTEGKSQPP